MACVDLPALPLQLLLRERKEWRCHPAAVVDSDRPQGRILWVNERARAAYILPGMRYAAALSLSGELRAAEVPAREVEAAVASITRYLQRFSPGVEPSRDEPGVFWLDASGLERLHDSFLAWGRLIRASLERDERLGATVVVGHQKFATLAIARSSRGVHVFEDRARERAALRRVSLDRLPLDPAARDILARLGIHHVGKFADLPPEGIEKRFGAYARRLHRRARGDLDEPLDPRPLEEPLRRTIHLDYAEVDARRLTALAARLMRPLLRSLAERHEAVAELRLELRFDRGEERLERLRPAAPTLDPAQLVELIRLRLGSKALPGGVVDVTLRAVGSAVPVRQIDLFASTPSRSRGAAHRALARIRAELGAGAVVRARLRDAHLPEARFVWEPLDEIEDAEPCHVESGMLVRRIYSRPLLLPARPRHEPDGWLLRGLEQGPVARILGPHVISGGWWRRAVHREYHFAETQKGEILWVYYDRFRRRWSIQGRVE